MNPTKDDKLYWSKLASLGCVACRLDGHINNYVSIHHIDGRTKPGCHRLVLPLCFLHHQGGGGDAVVSVHPWRVRFEHKYGKQMDLKRMCDEMLGGDLCRQ